MKKVMSKKRNPKSREERERPHLQQKGFSQVMKVTTLQQRAFTSKAKWLRPHPDRKTRLMWRTFLKRLGIL